MNIESDAKHKEYINGPINVFRLEGEIFGIKKILYVFMDIHLSLQAQTECSTIKNKDISNYLIENFDKISHGPDSTKIYDFFLEIFPTIVTEKPNKKKYIYLSQVRKLFQKSFHINKQNKVGKSNTFPNVRFHFIDIRDYAGEHYRTNFIIDEIVQNAEKYDANKYFIDNIKNGLTLNIADVKNTFNILYSSEINKPEFKKPIIPPSANELSRYNQKDFLNTTKNIYFKILKKYNHPQIQDSIHNYIDNELKNLFNNYFESSYEFSHMLDQFYDSLPDKLSNNLIYDDIYGYTYHYPYYKLLFILANIEKYNSQRSEYNMDIFVQLMDLFFLRRFLDKDYITNGIIYTGASHSNTYIYFLVKYFNFKITHYSYLKVNPQDLEEKIKQMDKPRDLEEYTFPSKLYQCSNMSNFPPQFQ